MYLCDNRQLTNAVLWAAAIFAAALSGAPAFFTSNLLPMLGLMSVPGTSGRSGK